MNVMMYDRFLKTKKLLCIMTAPRQHALAAVRAVPRASNRIKGRKYKYGGGLACQGYYNTVIRANTQEQHAAEQSRVAATPAKRTLLRDTPLLLTPERINHLQSTVRTVGIGQQGRSRSAEQNALMLLALHEAASIASPDTPPNQIIGVGQHIHPRAG